MRAPARRVAAALAAEDAAPGMASHGQQPSAPPFNMSAFYTPSPTHSAICHGGASSSEAGSGTWEGDLVGHDKSDAAAVRRCCAWCPLLAGV